MEPVADFDGEEYQAKFDRLAAQGVDVHGEASLVLSFEPVSVLDAGCGTGRVATELARRGVEVVGVDVNASMIAEAMRRAPDQLWLQDDLSTLALGCHFDVVLLAGNVPLFCPEVRRPALVESCAAHVAPTGVMVAGFQLDHRYELEDYDSACQAAGLTLLQRWATWDRHPFVASGEYAVSVHQR